jgi:hypothetical protein
VAHFCSSARLSFRIARTVEVGVEDASPAADLLAECMDQAQHTYLKRVTLSAPDVVVSDHSSKE